MKMKWNNKIKIKKKKMKTIRKLSLYNKRYKKKFNSLYRKRSHLKLSQLLNRSKKLHYKKSMKFKRHRKLGRPNHPKVRIIIRVPKRRNNKQNLLNKVGLAYSSKKSTMPSNWNQKETSSSKTKNTPRQSKNIPEPSAISILNHSTVQLVLNARKWPN